MMEINSRNHNFDMDSNIKLLKITILTIRQNFQLKQIPKREDQTDHQFALQFPK